MENDIEPLYCLSSLANGLCNTLGLEYHYGKKRKDNVSQDGFVHEGNCAICVPLCHLCAMTLLRYVAYDCLHYAIHHCKDGKGPAAPWLRALRRKHLHHHFKDGKSGFGISSPLWDVLFRTIS